MKKNYIEEMIEINTDAVLVDGFDDCIIGIGYQFGREPVFVYNEDKMLEKLVNRDGMTYDEAVDYFDYNIIGSYINESNPIFLAT